MDPRESMRDPRDHRMSLDPNDHIRVIQPMGGRGTSGATGGDPRAMSQGGGEMRGDPRGISGRLNGAGAAEAMWNQPQVGPPHHPMSQGQVRRFLLQLIFLTIKSKEKFNLNSILKLSISLTNLLINCCVIFNEVLLKNLFFF